MVNISRTLTGVLPRGGVVSPIIANIYVHFVLDDWFEQEVKPRLKGQCFLIRFADDAVLGLESTKRICLTVSAGRALQAPGKIRSHSPYQENPSCEIHPYPVWKKERQDEWDV